MFSYFYMSIHRILCKSSIAVVVVFSRLHLLSTIFGELIEKLQFIYTYVLHYQRQKSTSNSTNEEIMKNPKLLPPNITTRVSLNISIFACTAVQTHTDICILFVPRCICLCRYWSNDFDPSQANVIIYIFIIVLFCFVYLFSFDRYVDFFRYRTPYVCAYSYRYSNNKSDDNREMCAVLYWNTEKFTIHSTQIDTKM